MQEAKALELFYIDDAGREIRFKPVARVPSFDLRDELAQIAMRYEHANIDALTKVEADLSKADNPEYIRDNADKVKQSIAKKWDIRRDQNERVLAMVQAIINPHKLKSDKEKELVASDITGPFYRSQDLEAAEDWVDRFCGRNGIG